MERDRTAIKGLIEALLFVSGEPLKLASIAKSAEIEKTDAREILDELILDYSEKNGGFLLKEIAGAYQFVTNEGFAELLGNIFKEKEENNFPSLV